MAAFIIFIIALGIAYLILWTPFVNNLNREVSTQLDLAFLIDLENQVNADHHSNRGHPKDTTHSGVPSQLELLPEQDRFSFRCSQLMQRLYSSFITHSEIYANPLTFYICSLSSFLIPPVLPSKPCKTSYYFKFRLAYIYIYSVPPNFKYNCSL